MTTQRRWAIAMLRAVIRHAPEASREWASAMLRELDYIESDWAALWWALGSVAAICRHAGRDWRKYFGRREERTMNEFGKKTEWLFAGMGVALALGLAAALAFHLTIDIFPSLRPQGPPWLPWAVLIGVPQIAFIVGLWRKRRPMAVGVLVMAIAMSAHIAVYLSRHWHH